MKLDTRTFRYLSPEDWRVLTAVEIGSKNHEVVPTTLISQLSGLRTGSNGVQKSISSLAKADLIARVKHTKYDGYRLTYGGLDYLALHAHTRSSAILHLGSQMGVGKESDIYLVTSPAPTTLNSQDPSTTTHLTPATNPAATATSDASATQKPVQSILKIHRLGRTSFRSLARNRDYQRHRQHCTWQHLSRLSAQKEYAAMCALYDAGFPVPRPIACNRHTIVMSLVPGVPLKDVPLSAFSASHETIAALYSACIELALRLASHGLIHGDLNEFNILVENVPEPSSPALSPLEPPTSPTSPSTGTPQQTQQPPLNPMIPHLIDFPQITSLAHPDAERYFARDIACIKAFFGKRYHFFPDGDSDGDGDGDEGGAAAAEGASGPTFADAHARLEDALRDGGGSSRLDVAIEAAGFSRKASRELEAYFAQERQGQGEGDEGTDYLSLAGEADGEGTAGEVGDVDVRNEGRGTVDSALTDLDNGAEVLIDHGADPSVGENAEQASAESAYSSSDPIMASKLGKLSLQPRSISRPKAKAAAGWSI